MKQLTTKNVSTHTLICGTEKHNITQEEYDKIDELLEAGKNRGLIRLKNGDWINMAYVSNIKTKTKKNEHKPGELYW